MRIVVVIVLAVFIAMCTYSELYDRFCRATGHDPDGADRASPREVLRWAFRRK